MKRVLKESLSASIDYAEYKLLFKQLVSEGRTSGEPTEEKINYTKLNFSRSKRLDKTIVLTEAQKHCFQELDEKQTWLVITEPWCVDAAQSLSFFNKIAESSENIELKIVLRDENPELMDAFLTNGARSIPKLIMLDQDQEVLHVWGPRSAAATKLVEQYVFENGKIDDASKTKLQLWYNENKGKAILNEITDIVGQFSKLKTTGI